MANLNRKRVPRIKSSAEQPTKKLYRFKVVAGNVGGVQPGGTVEMMTTDEHAKRLVETGRAKILSEPSVKYTPKNRPLPAVDEKE